MKNILTISLLLLAFCATSFAHNTEPTHGGEVDLAASTITWSAKKITATHTGGVTLKSGSLDFKNHSLTGGEFVMDMTTITCTDLDGEWGGKLIGHLNSADFFETDKYPTSKLVIKEISKSTEGNAYAINAELTIKGITKPVGFTADVSAKSATALITIDRTAYDIKYGSGSFFENLGDKAIENEFQLSINLVLK